MSIRETIRLSWKDFRLNWKPLTAMSVTAVLAMLVFHAAYTHLALDATPGSLLSSLVFTALWFVLLSLVTAGLCRVYLRAVDGGRVRAADVFVPWRQGANMLVAMAAANFLVSTGLLFLILPGLYVFYRVRLFPYFLVDRGCGPLESIRASWCATRGEVLRMVLLDAVACLAVLAGVLCLVVGVVPAGVYSGLLWARYYKDLSAAKGVA